MKRPGTYGGKMMGLRVRNELSRGSKYYISRHRYLELKHFCLQYNEWQRQKSVSFFKSSSIIKADKSGRNAFVDETGDAATTRGEIDRRSGMILKAAEESDRSLARFLFLGVTQGLSFNTLKTLYEIPCERDMYYDRYRKFFWILDKMR